MSKESMQDAKRLLDAIEACQKSQIAIIDAAVKACEAWKALAKYNGGLVTVCINNEMPTLEELNKAVKGHEEAEALTDKLIRAIQDHEALLAAIQERKELSNE